MSSREYDRRKNTNSNPSVTKIIRRLRGEGLSKTYWMADENCKECYDCKSVFTTWRRKHHCRICGQIFCSRCAPNIIKGMCRDCRGRICGSSFSVLGHRFGHDGMVRVCNLCLAIMDEYDDEEDTRSVVSAATSSFPQSANPFARETADSPRTAQSPFAASQLFSFSRPHTELAAISEQHAPQQQRWRSSDSDRLSDDEPIERSGHTELDSPTVGSMPVTPEMRGRGFERRPIGDDHHESGPHPLLGQMSPRGSSRPPGDGAPFRRAIQEEDNDATDGAAKERDDSEERASAFPLGNGKAELAGAILSNGSDIHAIRSPRQRTGAALLDAQETQPHGNDRSFIAFPTSSNGTEVANLLSPVTDHRKAANSSIPPGLLRSRLSSRMSTSGLSSVLLTEVTGPNGMWRSRVDSIV
jgi:1-phosphatidylinositol-3-phosphate 5-kinase